MFLKALMVGTAFLLQNYALSKAHDETNEGILLEDFPYVTINCRDDVPIYHSNCPNDDIRYEWCFHIEPVLDGFYPNDGSCIVKDPNQGLEPSTIAYNMMVRIHNDYIAAGPGIFFNFQDQNNYDVVYKLNNNDKACILGYVSEGELHNSTEYDCGIILPSNWMVFNISVQTDEATISLTRGFDSIFGNPHTFKPRFPMSPIAGPLILNAFGNSILHIQHINLTTETCSAESENDICNPCNYANNVQSTPELPLPNSRNYMLWHPRALELVYTVCYIKVLVESEDGALIKSVSKVGTFENEAAGISIGDPFGERNQCTRNETACVEVKIGNTLTDGVDTVEDISIVEITLGSKVTGLSDISVNPNLHLIYGNDIIEESAGNFSMRMRHRVYGPNFGIYCETEKESAIKAQEKALNSCKNGYMSSKSNSDDSDFISKNGWAVKFN